MLGIGLIESYSHSEWRDQCVLPARIIISLPLIRFILTVFFFFLNRTNGEEFYVDQVELPLPDKKSLIFIPVS